MKPNPQSESIRIRFSEKQKKRLLEEKNRTDRSASDIVRQAVDEIFREEKTCLNFFQKIKKAFQFQKNTKRNSRMQIPNA